MSDEPVAFGPFLLDPASGTLLRDGEVIAVGQRGALLLKALLKASGQVVVKADLMDAAWPGTAVEESNLSVQIASLRKLLGPAPSGGEWIATVPRVGYRFAWKPDATGREEEAPRSGLVVPSLAVLPFHNLSGDPEQDYFADGVVEDIITALSRFKSFAVIARNSSFVFKGRAVDVREIARDLGVRYVLKGSVRRAGDRLRIGAQLVDGTTGAHLWAQNFDGALDEVFDFQDRITEGVATVVELEIQIAEIARSRRERPGSIAAYDLYLRALPKVGETEQGNREAYRLLTDALALEPDNGRMLALASRALSHHASMGWPAIEPDQRERAAKLARDGLRNAAGDAPSMALCGMALVHAAKGYDLGMAAVRSALEANPNSMVVVVWAGVGHLLCGEVEEALACFHRSHRLSPRDPAAHVSMTGIAHAQMVLGDYGEALLWATRSLAINPNYDPTYWMLIAANAHLGRTDEANRVLVEFRRMAPDVTIARIKAGQPDKYADRLAAILDGLRLAGLPEA